MENLIKTVEQLCRLASHDPPYPQQPSMLRAASVAVVKNIVQAIRCATGGGVAEGGGSSAVAADGAPIISSVGGLAAIAATRGVHSENSSSTFAGNSSNSSASAFAPLGTSQTLTRIEEFLVNVVTRLAMLSPRAGVQVTPSGHSLADLPFAVTSISPGLPPAYPKGGSNTRAPSASGKGGAVSPGAQTTTTPTRSAVDARADAVMGRRLPPAVGSGSGSTNSRSTATTGSDRRDSYAVRSGASSAVPEYDDDEILTEFGDDHDDSGAFFSTQAPGGGGAGGGAHWAEEVPDDTEEGYDDDSVHQRARRQSVDSWSSTTRSSRRSSLSSSSTTNLHNLFPQRTSIFASSTTSGPPTSATGGSSGQSAPLHPTAAAGSPYRLIALQRNAAGAAAASLVALSPATSSQTPPSTVPPHHRSPAASGPTASVQTHSLNSTVGGSQMIANHSFAHPPENSGFDSQRSHASEISLANAQPVRTVNTIAPGGGKDAASAEPDLVFGGFVVNQYMLIQTLGRGQQGEVFLGVDTTNAATRAVKVIKRPSSLQGVGTSTGLKSRVAEIKSDMLRNEIAIMKQCRHRNVVALYEVIDDPEHDELYLVMQYARHGSLCKLKPNGTATRNFTPPEVIKHGRQLCAGLRYLHRHGIIHRDIKPENVLLGDDETVFLSDFGVSSWVSADDAAVNCGTLAFLSPETLVASSHGGTGAAALRSPPLNSLDADAVAKNAKAADVWALGLTLFVMLFGHLPWPMETIQQFTKCVINDPIDFPPLLREGHPLVALLGRMLHKQPTKRYTAAEAHVALRGLDDDLDASLAFLPPSSPLQAITAAVAVGPIG